MIHIKKYIYIYLKKERESVLTFSTKVHVDISRLSLVYPTVHVWKGLVDSKVALGIIVAEIETQKESRVSKEYLSWFMSKPAVDNHSSLGSIRKKKHEILSVKIILPYLSPYNFFINKDLVP